MASKIKVDQLEGSTGSTITVPTGQTLTITDGLAASTISSGTLADARLPTIPVTKGGTGLTSLGSAGQVVKVNSGANALEFGDASGGGKILQVKSRSTTSVLSTSTNGFVASDNYVQITPSATSSKLYISIVGGIGCTSGDPWLYVDIYRQIGSGSFTALSYQKRVAPNASATLIQELTHQFIDEPNTTSQVTYKAYLNSTGTACFYNGRSSNEGSVATGIAMEIGA